MKFVAKKNTEHCYDEWNQEITQNQFFSNLDAFCENVVQLILA